MSDEFQGLLRGYLLGDLTTDEHARLEQLGHENRECRDEYRAAVATRAAFEGEVALRSSVLEPAEPAEEAQESWQRLARVVAREGDSLRAKLLAGASPVEVVPASRLPAGRRWGSVLWLAAAAVFVGLGLWLANVAGGGAAPPGLEDRIPENKVLGDAPVAITITFRPAISASERFVIWQAVPGAVRYTAQVWNRSEALVERPVDEGARTAWELSEAQYRDLRAASGEPLTVLIVAFDAAGNRIASSGNQPLRVD